MPTPLGDKMSSAFCFSIYCNIMVCQRYGNVVVARGHRHRASLCVRCEEVFGTGTVGGRY